jgi:hypothetical protein
MVAFNRHLTYTERSHNYGLCLCFGFSIGVTRARLSGDHVSWLLQVTARNVARMWRACGALLGDYQGAFVDCTEALKGTTTPSSVTSTSPKLMQARLAASRTPSTTGGDHIRDVLRAVLFACFLYARKYIIYNIVTATCLYIQKHDAWSLVGKKA